MTWMAAAVSVVAAILVSPLLAAWTVGLTTDPDDDTGTVVAAQAGERCTVGHRRGGRSRPGRRCRGW